MGTRASLRRSISMLASRADDVPARAGRVDEPTMQRRLAFLFRGMKANPRTALLQRWLLDYWRERQ
jgi:hypothetical protein